MTGWTMAVALQTFMVTGADYNQAYSQSVQTGRPLVVLVGADWCPACVTMKTGAMAQLKRSGALDDVIYTVVNKDNRPDLAAKLMRGKLIPQLVVFSRCPSGWQRQQLTGVHDTQKISQLIDSAVRTAGQVSAEVNEAAAAAN